MIQLLQSNTTLDIRINNDETEPFNSNMGSPQGDALSGELFDIYFEESLRKVRSFGHDTNSNNDENGNKPSSFLPQDAIYAGDADLLTTSENKTLSQTDLRDSTKRQLEGTQQQNGANRSLQRRQKYRSLEDRKKAWFPFTKYRRYTKKKQFQRFWCFHRQQLRQLKGKDYTFPTRF